MKTILSGILYSIIGVAGVILSNKYPMGELYMMGPGLFPSIISSGILICGLILILKGMINAR
jgi:hypothetical protein